MVNRAHPLNRDELIYSVSPYKGYATSDGAAPGTTIIDSHLIGVNDFLTNRAVIIMSGPSAFEIQTASAFAPLTGTITFGTGFSHQITAGTDYRLLTAGAGGGGGGGGFGSLAQDAIYFDPANGDTLAHGNDGSPGKPLSTPADVLTQVAAKKLSRVKITSSEGTGGTTFIIPSDITGISFWGDDPETCSISLNGKNVTGCDFHFLKLSGANGAAATSASTPYDCIINGMTDNFGWNYHSSVIGLFTATGNVYCNQYKCNYIGLAITFGTVAATIKLNGTGDVLIQADTPTNEITVSGAIEIGQITGTLIVDDQTTSKLMALPSSVVQIADDAEQTTAALVFTQIKIETLGLNIAGCTIKFDLKTAGGGATAHARIYKNGVAIGTDQTDATGAYQTFSQTLALFNAGDTIELWAYTTNALDLAYVRNFRICYEMEAAPPVGDGVYVDSVNGVAGTAWPIGTAAIPNNDATMVEPIAIATERHLDNIYIIALSSPSDPFYGFFDDLIRGFKFIGDGIFKFAFDLGFSNTASSVFENMELTGHGNVADAIEAHDCLLSTLSDVDLSLQNCKLLNTIKPSSGIIGFNDHAELATLDLTNVNGYCFLSNMSGELSLSNSISVGTTRYIYGNHLKLTIGASCTAGTINVYGDTKITNNSGGTVVNDYTNKPNTEVPVNITAILASETNFLDLETAGFHYTVDDLVLKCADPGVNTINVKLYKLVNGVLTAIHTFAVNTAGALVRGTSAGFALYLGLDDMFTRTQLAGDQLKITVQATGGGPYAVTGSYAARSA